MTDAPYASYGIPGAVAIVPGMHGLPKVVLHHASGASAEIYLHGGHITSWKSAAGEELFFVSREAIFAAEKAIRGGIPVVFPQFGSGTLPQHGLVRTREWALIHTEQSPGGRVTAVLQRADSDETRAAWPHRFDLRLATTLDADTLTVAVELTNTDEHPFSCQLALHTYFAIADIRQTTLEGLAGVTYIDALRDDLREVESRALLRFTEETDRIYQHAPDCLRLHDEGRGRIFTIEKTGMPDVVVWNPWIAKAQRMADFGDEEYLRMLCVETGRIIEPFALTPQARWTALTRLHCRP